MYTFEWRIRYSEVDQNQKLGIGGLIDYLQDCSTFQSEDIGKGINYLKTRNEAWWLSSWQIEILRYPKLGENIKVSTWPYEFRGIYGYRNFLMEDSNGEPLVKANSIWFFFDTKKQKPIRIGKENVEGYGEGERGPLEMKQFPKRIPVFDCYSSTTPIVIMQAHIDTNGHVNNAQYIVFAKEAANITSPIHTLQVEYKKGAVIGDIIYPRVTIEDGKSTVVLANESGEVYSIVSMEQE